MEIRNFSVEKEKADGMKLEASLIKANQLEKEIKKSISEQIMVIGNLIQLYLEEAKQKRVL